MKKYVFNNIVGEEIILNVHDSITEKGISNYPKSENRIIYIDEFKDFFKELFSGFGDKKLTVLDIGSNGGIFSIYCSPVCEKIYAIEASAVLCKAMKEFTSSIENITICNNAISSKNGIISFYFIPDCTGQSTIHQRIKAKDADPIRLIVNSYTILSFIKQHKIDYVDICKVDIEGEEVNIFSDEDINSLYPYVDKFWVEVHYTANINGKMIKQNYKEITDRFKNKGYSIFEDITNCGFIARRQK
jgi:FkbM family methyltransferase